MATGRPFEERLARLRDAMRDAGVDVVAFAPTANMRYLLGFHPFPDERPCALLISQGAMAFVVPELNADQVTEHTGLPTIRWTDAQGPNAAFNEAFAQLGLKPGAVMAVDEGMRADHLLLLQELSRPAKVLPAASTLAGFRVRKTPEEIELLARAADLADRALMAGVEACTPGATERDVAHEISRYFLENGAEAVDFTIVASGPNGAFPHHETSDRTLMEGDTVIIDIGATVNGYKSDVTRVVYLGDHPLEEVRRVYQAVLDANARAREAVRPGVKACDIDRAARETLERAGYGRFFLHRTGHGMGLETHEAPWVTGTSETVLEPGMVISIEPGVYLAGRFGVRIEDIVVVTEEGHRCLTGLDRALICRR